jgi:hypothetical protein
MAAITLLVAHGKGTQSRDRYRVRGRKESDK